MSINGINSKAVPAMIDDIEKMLQAIAEEQAMLMDTEGSDHGL